MHFVEILHSMH